MSELTNHEAAQQIECLIIDNEDEGGVYLGQRDIKALEMAIAALTYASSAEPESNCSEFPNNWIPCSRQKYPDHGMDCYVTVLDDDGDLSVSEDIYHADSECWDEYSDLEVIAWMPKNEPEPYREEES